MDARPAGLKNICDFLRPRIHFCTNRGHLYVNMSSAPMFPRVLQDVILSYLPDRVDINS